MALTLGVVTVGAVPAAAALGAPAGVVTTAGAHATKVYGPFAVGTVGAPTSSAAPLAESTQPFAPVSFVTTTALPGSAAAKAIEFALAQRGLPYVWGGNGPQNGDAGFDCSGLTTAAYAYAGITLPRTAHTQYYAGPHVPDNAPLRPGDLVFYGVPQRVHHVGLYIGGGRMVNAPTFGKPVQLAYVRYKGDDYIGATRPAADANATGLIPTPDLPVTVPPVPSPSVPAGPSDFMAPVAPDPAPDRVSGPATAQQLEAAAEGTPDQQADVGTILAPPAQPPVDPPPVIPPPITPPVTEPPTTTTPPPSTTPPPDTTPPPTTTPPPDTTPPPATTPPPDTTPPPPITPTTAATPPATAAVPTGLVMPGGSTLRLLRAASDASGLPRAPLTTGFGSLGWHPGTGDAWTAAVRLHAGAATGGLTAGATVVVTGPGGATTTLTISSVRTTDAATAKSASRTVGSGPRLVLLQTTADGQVLVVVAS